MPFHTSQGLSSLASIDPNDPNLSPLQKSIARKIAAAQSLFQKNQAEQQAKQIAQAAAMKKLQEQLAGSGQQQNQLATSLQNSLNETNQAITAGNEQLSGNAPLSASILPEVTGPPINGGNSGQAGTLNINPLPANVPTANIQTAGPAPAPLAASILPQVGGAPINGGNSGQTGTTNIPALPANVPTANIQTTGAAAGTTGGQQPSGGQAGTFVPFSVPANVTLEVMQELGLSGEQKAFQIAKLFAETNQQNLTPAEFRAGVEQKIKEAGISEDEFVRVKRALGLSGGEPALDPNALRTNISSIQNQFGITQRQVDAVNEARRAASGELTSAQRFATTSSQLQDLQLSNLQNLGTPTPQEIAQIERARLNAQRAGEISIDSFFSRTLRKIRDELAPSLGLRPGDTPIIDRGGFVAEEALRQQGSLTSTLAAQAAQARLQVPLQRSQVLTQGTLGSLGLLFQGRSQEFNQQFAVRQQDFAEQESLEARLVQLRQLSLQNMIALQSLFTGGSTQLAGLATQSVPFPQLDLGGTTIGSQQGSQTVGSNQLIGQGAGAVGGALAGATAGSVFGPVGTGVGAVVGGVTPLITT